MTTGTTSSQTQETASAPEVDTSVIVDGDQPLIPDNFVEGVGLVDPGASTSEQQGAENEEENGAVEQTETTTDESPSESTEAAESTETVAESTETADGETEATEEETPEVVTFTEEQHKEIVGKIESSKDKQINELTNRIGALEQQTSQDSLNVAVQGYATAINQQLVDQGMDQNMAQNVSAELATAKRQAFELTQERDALKAQLGETQNGQQQTAAQALATQYANQYGVPQDKMGLLTMATDDASMRELAEELGSASKLRQEQVKAKQAEVPAGGEANKSDSGAGQAGSMSGEDWITNVYNLGLSDDHDRAARS
jgi:cytochrome c biogenesis protein ResB